MTIALAITHAPVGIVVPWCNSWNRERTYSRGCTVYAPGPRMSLGLYTASKESQGKDPNAEDGWVYWVPAAMTEAEREQFLAGYVLACTVELRCVGDWTPDTYEAGTLAVHAGHLQISTTQTDAEPDDPRAQLPETTDDPGQRATAPMPAWLPLYAFAEPSS